MKILISLTYYHPYISGISEYARRLAESLGNKDAEVVVICNKHEAGLADEEIISNVTVRRFKPEIKSNKFMASFSALRWAARNIHKFDRVIINLPYPEAIPLSLLARINRKEIITIFHCEVALGNARREKILEVMSELSSIFCLAMSKKAVVNSLDYSQQIPYLRYFNKKLTEIYPPPGREFKPGTSQFTEARKKPVKAASPRNREVMTVGYLGRISREKNLETLVTAIEQNSQTGVKLLMAGPTNVPGEEDYFRKIKLKADKSPERIKITGRLDNDHLRKFFETIDILVLPSDNKTESFGMVQLEAMIAGIPVIAPDLPGIRTPINLTGAGYLINRPRDPKEWGDKINKARANLLKLREKTATAKNLFGVDQFAGKWRKLIYEIPT